MTMKTASTIFLAAAIFTNASCQRLRQLVPLVGVDQTTSESLLSPSAPGSMSGTVSDNKQELIKALEFDSHVTVVSPVGVGHLLCDTLVEAEDAATLSFVLLQNETVTAEKSFYAATDGGSFTDGIGRKVWTGVVTTPQQGEDEAVPRTVSMTWGDVCDAETFLLKVTKRTKDEETSIVKTVPCSGSTTLTCLVEVMVEFDEPGEAISAPIIDTDTGRAISSDDKARSIPAGSPTSDSSFSDRQVQDDGNTVIDLMVLYSSAASDALGGVSSGQIETSIIESIVRTNQAFVNSDVALSLNAVHVGPLAYEQTSVRTDDNLSEIRTDPTVGELRDSTGADLVQMIGYFDDGTCGRAYLYEDNGGPYAFSTVKVTCLDSHTVAHEIGHNLGCQHNRENASYPTDYAHGLRYCSGDDPYRTIMSYSCGPPRVNYFSNPDVSYGGKPTGTESENNARALRDNMVDVSTYRDRVAAPPTPAPTTKPVQTEYTLTGCYRDSARNRVLSGDSVTGDRGMTTEVCAAFCLGYFFFGTEYGQECFCGVASDDPTELGGALCSHDCAGDASQTCGGRDAISVYEYTDVVAPPPAEYLGCWADSKRGRIMDVMQSDTSMTNDLCEEICSNYAFYGTQYGQECWCGDGFTDHTRYGESDSCNMHCAGDADAVCGGLDAMSVWTYN